MKKSDIWKDILKYCGEVLLATIIWSLLDCLWEEPVNIVRNLIYATIFILVMNMSEYIIIKNLKKKIEKN